MSKSPLIWLLHNGNVEIVLVGGQVSKTEVKDFHSSSLLPDFLSIFTFQRSSAVSILSFPNVAVELNG